MKIALSGAQHLSGETLQGKERRPYFRSRVAGKWEWDQTMYHPRRDMKTDKQSFSGPQYYLRWHRNRNATTGENDSLVLSKPEYGFPWCTQGVWSSSVPLWASSGTCISEWGCWCHWKIYYDPGPCCVPRQPTSLVGTVQSVFINPRLHEAAYVPHISTLTNTG